MPQQATTENTVFPTQSDADENTDTFVSEDVYAETNGAFTRVKCHDVYAFSSIATGGDFSGTVDSVDEMIQVGVEIEFPNGRYEVLVFQPKNILLEDSSNQEALLEALFNNGSVWIGDYNSIFTPAGFPKSWDTMVVPDIDSVESVFKYRDNSLVQYSPDTKEEILAILGGLSLIGTGFTSGMILGVMMNSLVAMAVPMGLSLASLSIFGDQLEKTSDRFAIDASHMWMQRIDISKDELDDCTPVSSETLETIHTAICGLNNEWTTSTVLNVSESPKSTELELFTEFGEEITVEYPTPADSSERFTLNRITFETGVGSVQMLEGEQVEVGLTSLGKEQDVAEDGLYRVRAISE